LHVIVGASWSAGSYTAPAGYTEAADNSSELTVDYTALGAAGATGAQTITATGNDYWSAGSVAIKASDAPILVGAGTSVATGTTGATITPTFPATPLANDIGVILVHRSDNTDLTDPAGWTRITPSGVAENNTTAQRVEVFIKRLTAGESAPAITAGSGTVVRIARSFLVRGALATGTVTDAIDVSGRQNNAAADTIQAPSVTTGTANTLALFLGAYEDDPANASTPTDWSVVSLSGTTISSDATLGYAMRYVPTSGTNLGTTTTTVSGGTFTNSPNVGIVLVFKPDAAATPTLTIPHLASASTLTAPTVTPGSVALTIAHLASAAALTAPTFSASATLSLAHLASAATLTAPTITPGAQAITIPHLSSSSTLTSPTLTPGSAGVTIPQLAASATLTAPALTATTTLAMPHLASAATLTAPTLTPGAVALGISHLASTSSLSAPTVAPGAATVTITHLASSSSLTAPSLTPGAQALTVPHLAASSSLSAPTLTPAAVSLTIAHLASASSLFDPSLGTVAPDTLTIAHLGSAASLTAPTLSPGAFSIAIAHLAASTTLFAPTLATDDSVLTLPHLMAAGALYDPLMQPGVVTLTLAHLTSASALYGLTLTEPTGRIPRVAELIVAAAVPLELTGSRGDRDRLTGGARRISLRGSLSDG
jgi:hypothetical protein